MMGQQQSQTQAAHAKHLDTHPAQQQPVAVVHMKNAQDNKVNTIVLLIVRLFLNTEFPDTFYSLNVAL